MISLEALTENKWLWNSALLIALIAIVYFVTAIGKRGINRLVPDTNQKYKARKAVNFLGYLLFILCAIVIFSSELRNFGVFLGVVGAGVAFALQEVIMSVAGWIYIIFSNKVSVGQRVKIGDIKGDIIDIGVLSITIMEMGDWINGDQYNGRITSLANSFIFKEKIQNYSSEYPFLWDEIQIPIRHGSNVDLAREKFLSIAQGICNEYAIRSAKKWKEMTNKFSVENANVMPTVTMRFDQNWIIFTIRYIVDYKSRRSTADAIFDGILKEIQKEPSIRVATSAIDVSIMPDEDKKEN